MNALLSDPAVQMILAAVVGFIVSEWRKGRDNQTASVRIDADVLARLKATEDWIRDHNTIHACVRELAATTQAMAKNVDRLTRRIDAWMASNPLPLRNQVRSPYEVPDARDWLTESEQ